MFTTTVPQAAPCTSRHCSPVTLVPTLLVGRHGDVPRLAASVHSRGTVGHHELQRVLVTCALLTSRLRTPTPASPVTSGRAGCPHSGRNCGPRQRAASGWSQRTSPSCRLYRVCPTAA